MDFIRHDLVDEVQISPSGEYVAATVRLPDRTALAVIRLSDMHRVSLLHHASGTHIMDFSWVTPTRLLYSLGERSGELVKPVNFGELLGANIDGTDSTLLIGARAGDGETLRSMVRQRQAEPIIAEFIDTLPGEPNSVLISTAKYIGSDSPYTQVEKMNIFTGARVNVAKVPITRAQFMVDHARVVRFGLGAGIDNMTKLYYRSGEKANWQLLNDQAVSHRAVDALGFSADNRIAYLRSDEESGPDTIYAFDTQTGEKKVALRDDDSDPYAVLYSPFDQSPYGVLYMDGLPRVEYFDAESAAARLHRSLQASFPGQIVIPEKLSQDHSKGLISVSSDHDPGSIYLFDYTNKKASFLMARNEALNLERMADVAPISFKARDGQMLHGYLTVPKGVSRKNLPLIVNPHGGPMGERDAWGFNAETQLLASRGYAVLQVNFRGSGNHGAAFERAGYRQWGGLMQDDVTDGTRWAITEGIADPHRICIYGASYGAYAALMGAAKEPDLYRCAAGHVGVYDLNTMYAKDKATASWGRDLLDRILGHEHLDAVSPNQLAARIKIPVFLTAGRADERAPPVHTEKMRDALTKLGKPVEAKIYAGEGHGFYLIEDQLDFYTRLLAFLDHNLGTRDLAASQ